jgi:hypothetical protein
MGLNPSIELTSNELRLSEAAHAGLRRSSRSIVKTILSIGFIATFVLPAAHAQQDFGRPSEPAVVGKWSLATGRCPNSYEFRADGSFYVVSGAERLSGSYLWQALSPPSATLVVTRTVTAANGRPDCVGAVFGAMGVPQTRFVSISSVDRSMKICSDATLKMCFGPMPHD